jgi:hypothetical protein
VWLAPIEPDKSGIMGELCRIVRDLGSGNGFELRRLTLARTLGLAQPAVLDTRKVFGKSPARFSNAASVRLDGPGEAVVTAM